MTAARIAFISILLAALAASALADGWAPRLSSHSAGPEYFLAIDKNAQTFFIMSRTSPLKVVSQFPCTTGQSNGDKITAGDLRTPEGVYFVGDRIGGGLDWDLYGNIAYTLNFPNPVDRLKGKSGSGIWIHGRGKPLVPKDTRGCVALNNPDLHSLEGELKPGTPVVIADRISWTEEPGEADPTARLLAEKVTQWADDWQSKRDAFFEYFDQEKFSQTEGAPFSGFVAHKKGIFAGKPWIHVMVDNVHVAPGPDYWVTWFDQYYRTSGLVSSVGKRFYWQQDAQGRWRIVGQEYMEASQDLEPKYLAVKKGEVEKLVGDWLQAWRDADLERYTSFYDNSAQQGRIKGREAIASYKSGIWKSKPPRSVEAEGMETKLGPNGFVVRFVQKYEDASGYADKGEKTMVVAPSGSGWSIVSEDWRRL